MKIKLVQLVGSQLALHDLAQQNVLPIKSAYWLGKVLRKAETELKHFEEMRVKLCQKYGTLNEKTNQYDFTPAKKKLFEKDYGELIEMDVELPGEPMKLDALGEARLSPSYLASLDWLVVE